MFNVIIKTILLYIIVIFAMRLMGKKQASQLQPYELVITLMISEVATTPMDNPGIPMTYGIIPAVTLILLYYFLNFLCLKSKKLHVLFGGSPAILIHNGRLIYKDIKRLGYNLSDLLEQLRISGYTKISEIQYAILETNGQLSVLPYASYAPLTPNDMGVEVQEDTLYTAVILDGKFYPNGLEILGHTKESIQKMMHTLGFNNIRDILLMTISDSGDVFIQNKAGKTKNVTVPQN